VSETGETEAPEAPGVRRRGTQLGRANQTRTGMWFWEVDRVLMLLVFLLIAIGLVAVAAASPATARRYSDIGKTVPAMYYFWRQLMWVGVSVPVMILVSMLPATMARRLSVIGAAVFLVLLVMVPFIGGEVNGARRWINFGISDLQPSEFLKPLFIVSTAWILSFRARDAELPMMLMLTVTGGLTALVGVLLMMQPDFGQTMVFGTVWIILLMVSGISPAMIGEEFGLISCAVIAILYVAIIIRVLLKLIDEEDAFKLLAATGLAAQFGVQAFINMAVNTGLAPSKGMTLPFISYGGSSMVALSIGMGLLLAFTRRNPYLKRSPYTVRWSGK
jgi:cell division protein FtsW